MPTSIAPTLTAYGQTRLYRLRDFSPQRYHLVITSYCQFLNGYYFNCDIYLNNRKIHYIGLYWQDRQLVEDLKKPYTAQGKEFVEKFDLSRLRPFLNEINAHPIRAKRRGQVYKMLY